MTPVQTCIWNTRRFTLRCCASLASESPCLPDARFASRFLPPSTALQACSRMSSEPFHVIFVGAGEVDSSIHLVFSAHQCFTCSGLFWLCRRSMEPQPAFRKVPCPYAMLRTRLNKARALGERLNVVAIVDPDLTRATQRKEEKLSQSIPGYGTTQICSSPSEDKQTSVDLVIIGVPPHLRGSSSQDLELRLLKQFDSKRWLIEKPVSAERPGSGQDDIARAFESSGSVVAVGYMLRALKAVALMREIIQSKGLTVLSTQAR